MIVNDEQVFSDISAGDLTSQSLNPQVAEQRSYSQVSSMYLELS